MPKRFPNVVRHVVLHILPIDAVEAHVLPASQPMANEHDKLAVEWLETTSLENRNPRAHVICQRRYVPLHRLRDSNS